MTARPGMADIIAYVRLKTDTREDETTVNGVAYWTDEQLQGILDKRRYDVRNVELIAYDEWEDGINVIKRYYFPETVGTWVEGPDTSGAFSVLDSRGNDAPAYTLDLDGRVVIFDETTLGVSYFLRCYTFDVRAAIADIWLAKAGLRAELIDWRAGGQNLAEDQEYQHCMQQYELYSNKLGVQYIRVNRVGYNYG